MSKNMFEPLSEEVRNQLSERIRRSNRTERVMERAVWVINRPSVCIVPTITYNHYEIVLSFVAGDMKLDINCTPFEYRAVATLGRQNVYVFNPVQGYDLDRVIDNFFTFLKENQALLAGILRKEEKVEGLVVSTTVIDEEGEIDDENLKKAIQDFKK